MFLTLAALWFAAQATTPVSAPGDATLPAPTLEMHTIDVPSSGGGVAERGTLRTPIVRAQPDSKAIGVDVWRFPRTGEASADAPPLFLLHGGPGWPGLEPNRVDWANVVAPIVRYTDLVIVGQRGIGTSTDTSCAMVLAGRDDLPAEGAPLAESLAYSAARCADCRAHWEALGYDLTGLNVKEAAADVDDVRRLLGYDQIALWGTSFGSHWGMTIMRFHPDIVARALLSGMEGPNHTYDMPSGVLHSLERMAAAAEQAPELAEHVPEEGLIEAFRALIESVDEEPFEIEVARGGSTAVVRIDGDALRSVALGYSGRVNSRGGMPGWPADLITMVRGDFEPMARALLANSSGIQLPSASFFMLDCGSGITRERLDELHDDPAARVVGNLGAWYEATCAAWNSNLGDDFRSDFVSDIPTVVVHGLWDVNTPFDNALECVPFFRHLRFIPVDGGSHGALREAMQLEPGFEEAIMTFLATGNTDAIPTEVTLPPIEWRVPG